jgi:chromosome segregation ATPase
MVFVGMFMYNEGYKGGEHMVEALLQEILQEVKLTRNDIQTLSNRVDKLEKRMSRVEERVATLEKDMASVKERLANVESTVIVLDEKITETKAISEAVRHGQEVLTAKYDALSLDVHELKGKVTHLTNVLEDKVLPLLHDHESGIQVLNNRVFKVESTLQRLVSP